MDQIRLLLARLTTRRGAWRVGALYESAADVPDRIRPRTAIMVGKSLDEAKWLVLDCPCDRGHRAMVNLSAARQPQWRVSQLRNLSVSPSIDDLSIDRCHYFIRNGSIDWVRD